MSANDLLQRGINLYHGGDLRESARLLLASAVAAKRSGDVEGEMLALSNLAEAYTIAGRLEDAERAAVQLLRRAREKHLRVYEVRAIGRLAMAVLQRDVRGQWSELQPQVNNSVVLARRLQLDYWVVQNLETLGACAYKMGLTERSLGWFQQALVPLSGAVQEEDFFRARIYAGLGELYAAKRQLPRSGEFLELAAEYSARSGSPHLKAQVDLARGRCALVRGDAHEALARTHPAYLAATRAGWQVEARTGAAEIARIHLELKQYDEAAAAARTTLALARDMKMPEAEVNALTMLARAKRGLGDIPEARELLGTALANARKCAYDDHVSEITLEIARTQ